MRGPDAARGSVQDPGTASLARGLRQCRCRRQARGGRVPRSRNPEAPEWIEVGVVTGAHGLRGEVRVKPFTDFAEERFRVGNSSWLQRKTSVFEETGEPEQAEIEFVRSVTTRGQLAYLLECQGPHDTPEELLDAMLLVSYLGLLPAMYLLNLFWFGNSVQYCGSETTPYALATFVLWP